MKILVTNDDGIDAAGLRVLATAAQQFGDVIVVAPDDQRSSCGHQVTTHRPLRIIEASPGWFSVDGTPADCVRIGLLTLAKEAEWVLAGVNDGGNLGMDIVVSGTVAAVREAAILGRRAIAFSQYRKAGRPRSWSSAESQMERILKTLLHSEPEPRAYWNVNFPDADSSREGEQDVIVCDVDDNPLPIHFSAMEEPAASFQYGSHYHARPRRPGSDVDVCFSGNVAVSKLRVFGSV